MLTITTEVNFDAYDLARHYRRYNREEVIEFIKHVDIAIGEWDFTLELCKYFAEKQKEYDAEVAQDAAKKKNV